MPQTHHASAKAVDHIDHAPDRAADAVDLSVEAVDHAAEAVDHAADAVAMQQLAALPGAFLPWTAYSMRPTAIVALLADVLVNDRHQIVECGSGMSTIYTARLLRQRESSGQIVSIDHDPRWASVTRWALEAEGLTRFATVIDAPLVDGWYDRSAIPQVDVIDLLVVDGPPAYTEALERSREPALGHFHPMLAEGATVFLDDARRRGEQAVLAAWTAATGRAFTTEPGGHAVSVG